MESHDLSKSMFHYSSDFDKRDEIEKIINSGVCETGKLLTRDEVLSHIKNLQ